MSNRKTISLLSLCFILLACNLYSQILLQGIVTDNGGEYLGNGAEPVVNALVTLTDQADTTRSFSAYTDEQGQYTIQILAIGIADNPSETPGDFQLLQNYPNPFNPSTVIGFHLSSPSDVTLTIYNVLGQKIKTLVNGYQLAGSSQVIWDATDDLGHGVAAGLYIYSLKANGVRINKKMLLIDGHQGTVGTPQVVQTSAEIVGQPVLTKQMAAQYLLQVTGDDIATYEQHDLDVSTNMTLNVTVARTVTDIDGNVYQTVKIGDQWWMAENLKVTHYNNGDSIPNVIDDNEWVRLNSGAYCAFANVDDNIDALGLLYNRYAINDDRNIAPEGWHIPCYEEIYQLERFLMSKYDQYTGKPLAAKTGWEESAEIGNVGNDRSSNNASGFSGPGAGYRHVVDRYSDSFHDYRRSGVWWLANKIDFANATSFRIYYFTHRLIFGESFATRAGLSIRCIKDGLEPKELPQLTCYLPLVVGNSWTYRYKYEYSSGWDDGEIKDGTEVWEIMSISDDKRSFRIKSLFNGVSYRTYDSLPASDSTIYKDQINYVNLILMSGPYFERPSYALVLDRYQANTGGPIYSLLAEDTIYDDRYLEVSFPSTSDSLLVQPTKYHDLGGPLRYSWLKYTIQKNLGFKEIEAGETYNDHGYSKTYTLIETNF